VFERLNNKRIVVDTNVFVSFVIAGKSTRKFISDLLEYIFQYSTLLSSQETINELEETLLRSKFQKYFAQEDAQKFITSIKFLSTFVDIKERIIASRDSNDNKFLDVAINGKADLILTGDNDLLELKEIRGIKILSPKEIVSSKEIT